MFRTIPLTLFALGALCASVQAQTSTTEAAEKAEPRELSTLVFDEAQYAFVDPESREPYNGPMTVTYPNGQLETDGHLANGLEDGDFTEYHADGTKSGKGAYQAGDEVGPWTYWWENGSVESEGVFKDGRMDGVWRDYFPSGKLAMEGEYVNGLAQGKWQVADENTGVLVAVYYDQGEEVAAPDPTDPAPAVDADASPSPTAESSPSPSPTAETTPAATPE